MIAMLRQFKSPRASAPELPPDPMLESFGRFLVVMFPLVGIFVTALVGGICGAVVAGLMAIQSARISSYPLDSDLSGIAFFGGFIGVCCGIFIGILIFLTMAWWKINLRKNTLILIQTIKYMALCAWVWELPLLIYCIAFKFSYSTTAFLMWAAPLSMIFGGIVGGATQRSNVSAPPLPPNSE